MFETALITRGVGKVILNSQLLVEGKLKNARYVYFKSGDIFIGSEEINEDTNALIHGLPYASGIL